MFCCRFRRPFKPGSTRDSAVGSESAMVHPRYVSPADGIVIAKNAADPFYEAGQDPGSHENRLETQGFAAFRAIAHAMRDA